MKQHEAVIQTFEKLNGIATLGQLYQEVFKIKECEWKAKNPFANIRRIVQLNKDIYKIKPGLYALKKYQTELENRGIIVETDKNKNSELITEFNHTFYQGLLVDIGNLQSLITFVPNQDKNKVYLDKTLKEITSISDIYNFTYPEVVSRAKTIDVIWFNERKFPASFFEVEHSTEFQNSFGKYVDLQDFSVNFFIVSSNNKKSDFEHKLKFNAFKDIKEKVKFMDYEFLSNWHTKSFAYFNVSQGLFR